jgi:hypothetical protein
MRLFGVVFVLGMVSGVLLALLALAVLFERIVSDTVKLGRRHRQAGHFCFSY